MNIVQGYLREDKLVAARLIQATVRSFFEYHDRVIKFKRVDKVRYVRKKVAYELIPSKDQVYRMAEAYKKEGKVRLRNRAVILCLFQSGVRVNCLLNWRVGMVRDQLYPETKIPMRLRVTNQVDTKLSGYGLPYYYTFLQVQAAQALKEYLDMRMKLEGELRDDDFIFKPILRRARRERLSRFRVLGLVKRSAKRIGLDPRCVWTHTLRKSFRKVLNASPIDEDTKEALMGHRLPGSRDNYFDSHDLDEIARKYMTADFSAAKKTEDLQKDLEASRAEIERLRVDLALAHSGRRMLEEELAAQARTLTELREEMRRIAKDLKRLKES
jgi:integrase